MSNGAGEGTPLTFGEPETSSLKTSFQEKVSLQNATGIFHPGLLAGVRATSYQSKNAPSGRSLIGAGEGTLTPGLVLGKDAL